MNQKELAEFPLKARVVAQDAMLTFLVANLPKLLTLLSDDLRSQFLIALKLKLDAAREDFLLMTFPELPPEQSDLMSAEFQDAFDSLARHLEQSLGIRLD